MADAPAAEVVALKPATSFAAREAVWLSAYTAGVVAAEAVLAYFHFLTGLVVHAVLVFYALTHYAIAVKRRGREAPAGLSPAFRALPALALVPLTRILSVAAAVKGLPLVFLTGVAAVPVMIGALMAARAAATQGGIPGFRAGFLPVQFLIGLSGVFLGPAAFFLVRPVTSGPNGQAVVLAAAIMAVAGVAEEVIFRGVVQGFLEKVAGSVSVAWSSLLFATLYIGAEPFLLLPFMAAAGLYFGWCVRRTRSIWGVCIAHAAINVAFVLGPFVT